MKVKMKELVFQAQFGLFPLPSNKFGHEKVSFTIYLQMPFHIYMIKQLDISHIKLKEIFLMLGNPLHEPFLTVLMIMHNYV